MLSSLQFYLVLLGPNIFLNTLFSHNFRLCSSHSMRDELLQIYKRKRKIKFLYVLIFILLGKEPGRQKILHGKTVSVTWLQTALNFFLNLNTSFLSKELLSVFILWLRTAFWSRDTIMYLVLPEFATCATSLLIIFKVLCFSLYYLTFHSIYLQQHTKKLMFTV